MSFVVWSAVTAQAGVVQFSTILLGANENPAVVTPGKGTALVTYDSAAHKLSVQATFSDLIGTTTVAHIHCCTDAPNNIGVATYPGTFPGFPVGVTSGSYSGQIDLTEATSFTTNFLNNFGGGTVAGAEAALIQGLYDGKAYFNIHTAFRPGGEIRGFLTPVPEPGAYSLGMLTLSALFAAYRRRRRTI
jgi:hypothetical protein